MHYTIHVLVKLYNFVKEINTFIQQECIKLIKSDFFREHYGRENWS